MLRRSSPRGECHANAQWPDESEHYLLKKGQLERRFHEAFRLTRTGTEMMKELLPKKGERVRRSSVRRSKQANDRLASCECHDWVRVQVCCKVPVERRASKLRKVEPVGVSPLEVLHNTVEVVHDEEMLEDFEIEIDPSSSMNEKNSFATVSCTNSVAESIKSTRKRTLDSIVSDVLASISCSIPDEQAVPTTVRTISLGI
jgi:hypothetical protein